MEQYAINGGNPLVGEVEIGGAKNAALPILAASLMTDETVLIENMPDVRDTNILLDAMAGIGTHVERIDRHTVKINGSLIHDLTVNGDSVKKIRASYYFLGALLGKYKKATVVLPGGCDIGCRAIDQHIKGFKALGATIEIAHGMITAEASHLCGAHIYLDVVSVAGRGQNNDRKCCKRTSCCGSGELFKQHGSQYQGRRYGCDPDPWCRATA